MPHRLSPDRHGGQDRAILNLVAPLADEATDKRIRDDAGDLTRRARSVAVSPLIGASLRRGDVECANTDSTRPTATTPGCRASTTATITTTTRTTTTGPALSADQSAEPSHAELSFSELVTAYFDCREHKRNTRSALAFETNLERNLSTLFDELKAGSYRPGPSICFVILRPKPREVWAAAFRDRIVHHLLYNRIAPRFYASFIADTCACIPGRGTLYAAQRLEAKVRSITQNWSRPAYYLKADLANFFVSIDQRILHRLLVDRIPEPWVRALAETILFHDPREGVRLHSPPARLALIPRHKSLFHTPTHMGLPIGNLSSQFFANVLLDVLDQYAKHRLGARYYIRYVDDFVLLHESAQWLNAARVRIEQLLGDRLGLRLNPSKTVLQPVERGIDFAGQVIKPWRRITRRRTVNDALSRLARKPPADFFESANSYFGLLRQASHSYGDRRKLARIVLRRGRCVDFALTKSYRGHT
jgi:RNA-directed DNA polymerase